MIPATVASIGQERLDWLKALPKRHCLPEMVLMHASPDNLWRAPLDKATNAEFQQTYGDLGHDIVIYAHIHRPYVRRLEAVTIANTGSVSLSYGGDPRASYLVVEGSEITIRRVDYDRASEAEELLSSRPATRRLALSHPAFRAVLQSTVGRRVVPERPQDRNRVRSSHEVWFGHGTSLSNFLPDQFACDAGEYQFSNPAVRTKFAIAHIRPALVYAYGTRARRVKSVYG
jgi:diadenosine tetraphosphatase ApaH/serine/threonine PP2A family protein phosphatase